MKLLRFKGIKMPKNFTFKEASDLANKFIELYNKINQATIHFKNVAREIVVEVEALTVRGEFAQIVEDDFEKAFVKETDVVRLQRIITLLYCYIESKKYSTFFKDVYSIKFHRVRSLLNDVLSAGGPLKWMFLSKVNKQKVENSYANLLEEEKSATTINAQLALEKLYLLKDTNYLEIIQCFEQDVELFKEALLQVHPNIKSGEQLNKVAQILSKYAKIQKVEDEITKQTDKSSDEITLAINRLIAEDLMSTLRSISVEELSRGQSGLRIKSLMDAGYSTVADTYAATVNQLESVYGISMDMAYTIKSISTKFAQETQKGLKLKLSVDNKSKAATQVILAVYKRRKQKAALALLTQESKKHKDDIVRSVENLKDLGSGRLYCFESVGYKNTVMLAYNFLKTLLAGQYGNIVLNAQKDLGKLVKPNKDEAWSDFEQNSIAYFNIIEEVCPGALGTDDQLYGLPEGLAREIQEECFFPEGLTCELRRYQEWGVKYILHQERVLLGDEMGLGKTVQAIATMVSLKNTGATHFVVVCPASVVTNWVREIAKHSKLRPTKIHGLQKANAFKSWLKTGGVAVTTYETTKYFKFDENYNVALVVLDEAHYIKNPEAQRAKNCKALCDHAERLLFMTGTPLENKVDEMINLVKILNPQLAEDLVPIAFMPAASLFTKKIAPVYYRRKRVDVLTELPELIETKEWCAMGPVEEMAYEDAVLNGSYPDARRLSWHVDDLKDSSKANRLKEIVEEAEKEGRKVLVFSFFLDTIQKIHQFLGSRCCNPITGQVNVQRRQQIIDEFNNAPAGKVLLAQILSGGTGLNIQSASVVVICEPQLKPSIENQAISRAYRMGQARNVLVYRLLCEDTIDERITDLLESKQQIFDAFADKSVAAEMSVEVDEKTLGKIIKEEIDRINKKNGRDVSKKEEETCSEDVYEEKLKEVSNITNEDVEKVMESICADEDDSLLYMNYEELVDTLLRKYGSVPFDYFLNENCKTKDQKNSRTKEGLFCHHIDEYRAIKLSDSTYALKYPYDYQKADRLVYCNLLEHFLLHVKIVEDYLDEESPELVGIGGAVNYICKQLNDYYGKGSYPQHFARAMQVIEDRYDDYIEYLSYLYALVVQKPTLGITKEDLAKGWEDDLVEKIYNDIDETFIV